MHFLKRPVACQRENSLTVDYDTLIKAIRTVTLIDSVEMEYLSGSSN